MMLGAPVSLRNRISLVLVAVVAVALVGANVAVYALASNGLEQRVEEQLDRLGGFVDRFAQPIDDGLPVPEGGIRLPRGSGSRAGEGDGDTDGSADRLDAEYVGIIKPDGTRPVSLFVDENSEDTVDRRPPVLPENLNPAPGESIFFETSGLVDGRREPYHMRATSYDNGTVAVIAVPTANLARDRQALIRLQVAAGVTVLLVLALLTRWLVGVTLRPLSRMEQAARRIADGDLTHRVAPSGPETEISRLGATLNRMLSAIEQAFATKEDSERRLRSSEQKLRRFVADASHEMRTPLTSIRGYAQLLHRDRIGDPGERAGAAGRIENQAARLSSLVDDLLLLARLDGEAPLRFGEVDLELLAGQVVDDARVVDPDRLISFEASGGARVAGDPDALTRMLTNLVANACRHTPPGTPVEVTVGGSADVVVEVADHGSGIPPELRPHVFNRFFRADRSRSRDRGGAGLGLAIVAGIVSAHRGRCEVRDTPGGGATFRVVLPGWPAHRAASTGTRTTASPGTAAGTGTGTWAADADRDAAAGAGPGAGVTVTGGERVGAAGRQLTGRQLTGR
jgi:two-component system OmpR family sensor kinase